MNGCFITVEGPEGAGKTTVLQMIVAYLEKEQYEILNTREPGGIQISEQIRSIILNTENTAMDSRTEALLYAAARRQHLVEKVKPALEDGKIVLCDRFIDSSLAYQGYARGIGVEEILSINEFAIDGLMPTITIYFDIDPEIGMSRIRKNQDREVNRLDLEKMDFHYKVREGYELLLDRYPNRIKKVNADQPIEQVFEDALQYVKKAIANL